MSSVKQGNFSNKTDPVKAIAAAIHPRHQAIDANKNRCD